MLLRKLTIGYLWVQAIGASLWWGMLAYWPGSRSYFKAQHAPDSTLMAFALPDVILFILAAGISGYGLMMNRRWAYLALCLHTGAACYATLYCWNLVALTGGDGLLGAILMSPSIVALPWFVWRLQPKVEMPC